MLKLRHSFPVLALAIAPFVLAEDAPPRRELVPATNVLPPFTAISAKGFVHSTERGFKFPDGSIQTTAAAGVSSVNALTGIVTIQGDDATSVTTSGNTIRVSSQATYKRTRVVSPIGPVDPNPLASGTALLNTLASITDATATNRYLLKIEPGVYDLGADQLVMKPSVDIEGSGVGNTIILTARGSIGDLSPGGSGVVAAAGTELRDLSLRTTVSVDSIGGSALWVEQVRNFRVSNVSIRLEGEQAALIAVVVNGGDLDAFRMTVLAAAGDPEAQIRGVALINAGVQVSLVDSEISTMGSPGDALGVLVNSDGGSVTIDGTDIVAGSAATYSTGMKVEDGTVVVSNSAVTAKTSPTRFAVQTGGQGNLTIHGSRLITGNVWNNTSILSAKRAVGSILRIHSSMLDSATEGSAACYHSTYMTGELDKTCVKEL
jgi:hypothetical protein